MASNLHGTAIVLGDRGVFIRGRSGAGKTELALELLSRGRACGMYARLVADDQLFISSRAGRLCMAAPATIAGLVEVRGLGPRPVPWQQRAVIDLVVTLIEPAQAERMPDPASAMIDRVPLPELKLAANNAREAASAVVAKLRIGLFDTVHMRQNG